MQDDVDDSVSWKDIKGLLWPYKYSNIPIKEIREQHIGMLREYNQLNAIGNTRVLHMTPFAYAIHEGFENVIESFLHEDDVDYNATQDKDKHWTHIPLLNLIYINKDDLILLLLNKKEVDVHVTDKNGKNAFAFLGRCYPVSYKVVYTLILKGVSPYVKDMTGKSQLDVILNEDTKMLIRTCIKDNIYLQLILRKIFPLEIARKIMHHCR